MEASTPTTTTIAKQLVDFVLLVVFKNTAANDIFQVICNIFGFLYDGRSTKVLDVDVVIVGGFFMFICTYVCLFAALGATYT